jgi:NADPH:quinone reductase-like Zn-dependent oxidoreductase
MRALHVPAAGEQPQLSEVPIPEVVDSTVLIGVKAAGLNAIDNGIAGGMLTEHRSDICSSTTGI